MKKFILLIVIAVLTNLSLAQEFIIDNQKPANTQIAVLSETSKDITLELNLNAYALNEVETPRGLSKIVTSPEGINNFDKGMPDLPYFTSSVIIPAKGKVEVELIESEFFTIENIDIAPSKGAIKRNVNPENVPYEYGKCYNEDKFIPITSATNSEAFCIRDTRGTTVMFMPFSYNPVQKVLKVYTKITVKLYFTSEKGENEVEHFLPKIDEFASICDRFFINSSKKQRYTQLQDGRPGSMLIICKDDYSSAMTDFIAWKREKGIATEMLLTSEIGTTASNIQTAITNYFSSHNDLAYILLVGDYADVNSNVWQEGSGYFGETFTSDNKYAYLVGNDHYADVFIGRFSGNNLTHIQTQVAKVLNYEKQLDETATWLSNAYSSASNEGGGNNGGHNQGQGVESDKVHTNYIQADLEEYGYTVTRVDQPAGNNYTSDKAATSAAFNNGVGLATYIGHGDITEWASTNYTNTQVNALTNENKNGFIISVACINGDFNGNTCFAEAWLRAAKNGNPTGALAFLGSSINQDWNPPMSAQDEMIDIITERLRGNTKRTIGGISFNGYFRMIQDFPASSNEGNGVATADTWTIFGDPSTMFRSKTPEQMIVEHASVHNVGQTIFTVNCNAENALVALTHVVDNQIEILGTGYTENGSANVEHTAITEPCIMLVTVTAYNKVIYQAEVQVIVPEGPYIVKGISAIDDNAGNNDGIANNGETISLNQTLKNVGVETANNVSMSISTESEIISISDNSEDFGNIQTEGETTKNAAFTFTIRQNVADQTIVPINYTITADNCEERTGTFYITISTPKMALSFAGFDDSNSDNANGCIDSNETASLKITLTNNGHAVLSEGNATISCNNQNVSIAETQIATNALLPNGQQILAFEISTSEIADSLENVSFTVNVNCGSYINTLTATIQVGSRIEDWETGDFSKFDWQNDATKAWTIVNTDAYEGTYCAKSGRISNSQSTSLSMTINCPSADNISFYKKVSCEAVGSGGFWGGGETYYDYLAFFIDGEMQEQWAGTVAWSREEYAVTAGEHVLEWRYVKDIRDASGSDCAWVDNIKLPSSVEIVTLNKEIASSCELSIFPNPASEHFIIGITTDKNELANIQIYNSLGQQVYESKQNVLAGENRISVELPNLDSGVYIIKASLNDKVLTRNLTIID